MRHWFKYVLIRMKLLKHWFFLQNYAYMDVRLLLLWYGNIYGETSQTEIIEEIEKHRHLNVKNVNVIFKRTRYIVDF